jgi:hypothetical protein
VLLTHANPEQVLRLTRRLAASFEGSPIVCHHDFDQVSLDVRAFPAETRFVRPHVPTRWGEFSVVEAILSAIRELYERGPAPDWFALLSGADYPLRPASDVLADLESGGADVYMRHEWIEPYHRPPEPPRGPLGYEVGQGSANIRECLRRYFRQSVTVKLPTFCGLRTLSARTSNAWLVRRLAPYDDGFRCFAGSTWFTANRAAAEYLLQWHARNPWLAEYLRPRFAPDETYFHTILCNAPSLRVANEYFRYVDWSSGGANPRLLGVTDVPAMLESGAHFARKFAPNDPALDQLDAALDAGARRLPPAPV